MQIGLFLAKRSGDPAVAIAVIAIIVVALVAIVLYAMYREKKRREGLAKVAAELGFEYLPGAERLAVQEMRYKSMEYGHSMALSNMLVGTAGGMPVMLFDFRYTMGRGKGRQLYQNTYARLALPGARLPHFTLGPEGFFHRVASFVGFNDIDFASHPEFSKRYLLHGEDETAIRALFDDQLLTALEGYRDLHLESRNDSLILWRRGLCKETREAYQLLLDEALGVFQSVLAAASRAGLGAQA